ncbi:ABC transporter permease [Pseudonocardia endophytica]|uniref:Transport permease protein n=1 Tax=Pseudonocardia endophytica TaxID=401976 RepID=A0A4R1HX14_PSEEN|nr:ABC transporter permease [Pseudonocardia endophytica]TCK26033.1 ABC-2 type transport system permease protein [Pseudonocardia endophytica]
MSATVHTGPRAALSDVVALVGRCARLARRDVETMTVALALPVLMLLLFVYVFGGAIDAGGPYLAYVVPGVVLLCAGFGASTTAPAVAADMTGPMIDRLRSMPVRAYALLVGHVTASVARNVVSVLLVLALAVALGFRSPAGPLAWLAAAGVVLGWIVALSCAAAAFGSVARSVQGANGGTFVMLFLPYLSSAFVPTETMPAFLRPIAEYQPVTPVTDAVRALLAGADPGSSLPVALAWEAGLLAVASGAAVVAFRRRTRT